MEKIEFIRWGDLSQQNHKKFRKESPDSFHCPPLNKGIYVFHSKWIEYFLVAWKDDFKGMKAKKIKYEGKIWTHLYHVSPKIHYYRQSGTWHETSTKCLSAIYKTEKNKMNKDANKNAKKYGLDYKRDAYKHISCDHLELFIEKIN